jgi:hypothetical protein
MPKETANNFKGPTFMYGPKGEAQIFTDSTAVPEGWTDIPPRDETHPPEKAPVPKPATGAAALPMTRDEIITALKAGNVEFKGNQGTQALYDTLLAALKAHCLAQEIAVPEGASAPDLFKLLEVKPSA